MIDLSKFNIPFAEALRHRAQRGRFPLFWTIKIERGFRGSAPRKFVSLKKKTKSTQKGAFNLLIQLPR